MKPDIIDFVANWTPDRSMDADFADTGIEMTKASWNGATAECHWSDGVIERAVARLCAGCGRYDPLDICSTCGTTKGNELPESYHHGMSEMYRESSRTGRNDGD